MLSRSIALKTSESLYHCAFFYKRLRSAVRRSDPHSRVHRGAYRARVCFAGICQCRSLE
jgi:hypothetical protein